MTTEMSPRLETSDVARHIARTAARLFATRGYDATSVREIVEEAGFKKPTLYYHFGSKEGLAQALLDVPLTALLATFQEIAASDEEPVSVLVRLVEAHFAFCRDDPDRARFYYAICFGPLGGHLAEELMRFGSQIELSMTSIFERLPRAGIVAPGRLADFSWACKGLITSAVMDFLYKGRTLDPGLARRLVGDLLRGFGEPGTIEDV
jgi:AcrR family transcriptional regulator